MGKKLVTNMSFDELVGLTDVEKDSLVRDNLADDIKVQFLNAAVDLNKKINTQKVKIEKSLLNIDNFDVQTYLDEEDELEQIVNTKKFMMKKFKVLFPEEELNLTVSAKQ